MSEQVAEFSQRPDLASRRLGGSVVAANDEFFAERENLIKQEPPVYRPHTFTNKGQEYDGWETRRRRRESGDHDWAIIRLGIPGVPETVVVDTAFFKGNYPPFVSVEGCGVEGYPEPAELEQADWEPIVLRSAVRGDTQNVFTVDSSRRYTHVRLRIYPDGGVARLRVHGRAVPDPRWLSDVPLDLAALVNGGSVIRCSDWFFSPPNNMLQPGESRFMADGWESARRRDDGHDWAVIELAAPALPRVLEIDTTHYKGNAPDRVSVLGVDTRGAGLDDDSAWFPVLPETRLQPDATHRLRVSAPREVTHLRVDSFPDGGIGRLRVYGLLDDDARGELAAAWFNALPDSQARAVLTGNGVEAGRASELAAARPFDGALPVEVVAVVEG